MKLRYILTQKLTPYVPRILRDWARQHIPMTEYDIQRRTLNNPYSDLEGEEFPDKSFCLGIIKEVSQAHKYYIAACREMKISYKLCDILADDWISTFKACNCDAFLVWPSSCSSIHKSLFDSRLRILEADLKQTIYPSCTECWLTEHKPRLRDWMIAHDIPHPKSWVAYRKSDALALIPTMRYPVVGKSATGASGKGVRILRTKRELKAYINLVFGKGIALRGFDPRDKHRGYVFLQEYLHDAVEWRMVRIGNSFFGYRKERGADGLHSGSHQWSWLDPGHGLLDLLKAVTETGGFTSMNVDVFLADDGRMLVNECQTTFGCSTPVEQMKIDDIEGRYIDNDGQWQFDPGEFSRNHMCNLRIQYLMSKLQSK